MLSGLRNKVLCLFMEYEALDEIKHSKKLSKYCGFVYWLQEKSIWLEATEVQERLANIS